MPCGILDLVTLHERVEEEQLRQTNDSHIDSRYPVNELPASEQAPRLSKVQEFVTLSREVFETEQSTIQPPHDQDGVTKQVHSADLAGVTPVACGLAPATATPNSAKQLSCIVMSFTLCVENRSHAMKNSNRCPRDVAVFNIVWRGDSNNDAY